MDVLATQHGFQFYIAQSLVLRGWLEVQQAGDASAAIEWLERGLAKLVETGVRARAPWLMACLAQALETGGQETRARSVVDEAIAVAGRTGQLIDLMQALTVKGELRATTAQPDGDDEAAACFKEVIAIAQRQAAKSMEL